jgi:phenylpropionate dioxygenase-like ring-hydroxylating dioxygenase large terminal subunit
LPPECYTSAAFFEFELDALWGRTWFCVGRDSDIPGPGDYYTINVGAEPLLVIRGEDGEVRVLSGVCQHRGMVVAEGRGCMQRIRCPFHFWTYSTAGLLLSAPDMTEVAGFDPAAIALPEIRSAAWEGFRFATFDREQPPLEQRLNRLGSALRNYEIASLRSAAPLELERYECNWKLFSDECYHCSFLHARSWHRLYPTPSSRVDTHTPCNDVEAGLIGYDLLGKDIDASPTRTGKALHPVLPRLSRQERQRLRYVTVMPNLVIVAMPDKVKYFLWLPAGPASSYWGVSWLFPEATLARPEFRETWDMERADLAPVMEEDILAWSRTQQGLASRFAPRSRYAPTEDVVVAFNRWCIARYRAAAMPDSLRSMPSPDAALR